MHRFTYWNKHVHISIRGVLHCYHGNFKQFQTLRPNAARSQFTNVHEQAYTSHAARDALIIHALVWSWHFNWRMDYNQDFLRIVQGKRTTEGAPRNTGFPAIGTWWKRPYRIQYLENVNIRNDAKPCKVISLKLKYQTLSVTVLLQ